MTRVALCFPGQGSQAAGMASGLMDSPLASRLLDTASAAGLDLRAALQGDDTQLRATDVAQPALLFTELTLADQLAADLDVVGAAGHSVGEYAAVTFAGGLSPEAALELVIARGRAMAAMTEGTMAAVIGLSETEVERLCAETSLAGAPVALANLNAPGQVVISGTTAAVERVAEAARAAGARRVLRLNVGGAFHSPLMREAANAFAQRLDGAALGRLRVPVACNVDGALVRDPEHLRGRLARQMESPVRWVACIEALRGLGAELLVEVGPGTVLSGLAKRIAPGLPTASVSTADAARRLDAQAVTP